MLLLKVIALSIHFPILASQTCHHAYWAYLGRHGGIGSMHILVVDKTIEEILVLHHIHTVPVGIINIGMLRRVLMTESGTISGLHLKALANLIFIVELKFPRTVTNLIWPALIIIGRRQRTIQIERTISIGTLVVHAPAVVF